MKKLIYSLVAMCCILSFVGCDKEFENKANIIRLSDENLTHKFFNGDDVAFYYECQFATDVKFEIMVKNSSTVLHTETASITPGEGILTFAIKFIFDKYTEKKLKKHIGMYNESFAS